MIATNWRGMKVLRCPPKEIHITLTGRLLEQRQNWRESSYIWKRYSLEKQAKWDWAAGGLGSAYHQEKIMAISTPGKIIKRSRGVLMSGYNYFKKCFALRKIAGFEYQEDLDPPIGIPRPSPPILLACYYDSELDGVVLELEEPNLLTYEAAYVNLENTRKYLEKTIEAFHLNKANPPKWLVEGIERDIERFEKHVRSIEAKGKKAEDYIYDEQRGIIWSKFSHIISGDGIITAKVDLPFPEPIKDENGKVKLSKSGRRMMRLAFTHLPTASRQAFPDGYANVADLSLAVISFEAETIVAWRKNIGAIDSTSSNIISIKTSEKTHDRAVELTEHLRKVNHTRLQRQRRSRVIEDVL
ncbi:MAG: hypothetical protein A2W23_04240 [Planctomycetes bacterium RBG_16_43_13]|nr:MAG: hypothetical protein A2W23_04240 [Planctomycetes bacterium RBG_16_43_13]